MAVTSTVFGLALQSLVNGEVDFDTNDIRAMLCTSSYSPNVDTHRYKSSVTGEVVGAGYTARGPLLTGKVVTYDAATNTLVLDADDPTWAASTITARYLIFYKDTGVDATSPLIALVDFGADIASTNDQFRYAIPAVSGGTGGLAKLTAT